MIPTQPQSDDFNDFVIRVLNQLTGNGSTTPEPKRPDNPRDDLKLLASLNGAANIIADRLANLSTCQCGSCRITAYLDRLNMDVLMITLDAIYKNDTSILDELVKRVAAFRNRE